jgi:hypothetical protein
MNEVLPFKREDEKFFKEIEGQPFICQVCETNDIIVAHFFLYDDMSFRCTTCGTGFEFVSNENLG